MKLVVARSAAWCGCLGLAGYLRLSGLSSAVVGDEVAAKGPDAAYHARRMLQTWADFPRVPLRDPLLDWPNGAVAPWPPGFDFVGALFALPASDRFSALIAISALPVVLGLVLVWATAFAARVLMPALPFWASLTAGFAVAVMPQAVSVARFANPDHHAVEALAMLALGTWSIWTCRCMAEGPLGIARRARIEAAIALIGFAALALFVGSSAYIAIAVASVGLANLLGPRAQATDWAVGAPGLLLGALLTALLYAPLVEAHGRPFDYAFPSFLQPALLALAAAGCCAASVIGWLVAGPRRRALTGFSVVAVAIALGSLALATHPATAALRHGLHEWFGGGNALLTGTTESVPLLRGSRFWEFAFWQRCHAYYGVFGLFAPVFFALAALACLERDGLRRTFPFFVWTFCIVAMTLHQNRFGRVGLVNLAIAVALAVDHVARHWQRGRLAVQLVPIAAFALDPAFHFYVPVGRPMPLPAEQEAGLFLRDRAPAPHPGRRSGVLTGWEQGSFILRYAQRPVTACNFAFYVGGRTFYEVDALWLGDEAGLLRFMTQRDLGFVAQGANGYASKLLHGRGPVVRSPDGNSALNLAYLKALPLSPLLLGGGGLSAHGVRHLGHLMPLHASSAVVDPAFPLPSLWVYERVAGARLRGQAAPHELVSLRLPMHVHGRATVHEAWTRADASGRFELVTPLPTSHRGVGFETAARAQLTLGERPPRALVVTEAQVRGGTAIDFAHDLGAGSAPAVTL